MKTVILLFVLFATSLLNSQTHAQTLNFTFDAAGNQSQRLWVCIGCLMTDEPTAAALRTGPDTFLRLRADAQTKELRLAWENPERGALQKIQVINSEGKSVFLREFKDADRDAKIAFKALPAGEYLLQAYHAHREGAISIALTNR